MTKQVAYKCDLCGNGYTITEVYGMKFKPKTRVLTSELDVSDADTHICLDCMHVFEAYFNRGK